MQAAAPLVLGVFQEQHAPSHTNMWEMLLAFVKAYPAAWHAVDMRKAVLPRLLAFLRSAPLISKACTCLVLCQQIKDVIKVLSSARLHFVSAKKITLTFRKIGM